MPKVVADANAPLDPYGVPIAPPSAPAPVGNIRCLFEDASGTVIRSAQGTLDVSGPLLHIAYDDPLKSGDEVRDILDPIERRVFVTSAICELPTDYASSGPQVYQTMRLREVVFP